MRANLHFFLPRVYLWRQSCHAVTSILLPFSNNNCVTSFPSNNRYALTTSPLPFLFILFGECNHDFFSGIQKLEYSVLLKKGAILDYENASTPIGITQFWTGKKYNHIVTQPRGHHHQLECRRRHFYLLLTQFVNKMAVSWYVECIKETIHQ